MVWPMIASMGASLLSGQGGGGGGGGGGLGANTSSAESKTGPVNLGGITFAPKNSNWQTVAVVGALAVVVLIVVARGRGGG